ncbi:hypothetical protein HS121_16245 [bacterium]|nr:hypothetical protein [bacterium]
MKISIGILLLGVCASAFSFAPTQDQCTVNVRYASSARDLLLIEGQTYVLSVDLNTPRLSSFEQDGKNLLSPEGIQPLLNGKPLRGPGRVNIYSFGTQMYEIHIRDLKSDGISGDIELALYAYGQRVFINLNVTPRGNLPATELSWKGGIKSPMALPGRSLNPSTFEEAGYTAAVLDLTLEKPRKPAGTGEQIASGTFGSSRKYPAGGKEVRSLALVQLSAQSPGQLEGLVEGELQSDEVHFDLEGGISRGYQRNKGFFLIDTIYAGPRSFEEGWINPNQRYEVSLKASLSTTRQPRSISREIICNVRNTYGVLEAAVLTDPHGFPLPVQVQVCKNFAGENEEGPEEGDVPYGESYFPLTLEPGKPFAGRVYHLFGNWGTHPLKQISSIRFFHHYFHASLGPTETFCYVPFEFPREDDRNYVLADVRGLSNFYWEGQPQHDHVSVVGLLRYKSGGKWINNLLQDTRIFLTAPNIASFALDYLSEDGKVKTTWEIFELPQDDESRCFMKLTLDVLDTVQIEESSARNLRFLNAGAYIVNTVWPHLAYTGADGKTARVDVPAEDKWVLEAMPLGKEWPFCAGYSHRNGNMAFFVNRFEGRLGGKDVDSFGLSCFGGTKWTEMFLTAPGMIPRLEKGDHIESHLFVMPYGHADVDEKPAERQRYLYGDNLASIEVLHGEAYPGFPRRMKADPRGFAEFILKGGDNWTPFLVDGFSSHKAPMLWEKRGDSWLFIDQQIQGNDWYQSYTAEDGSIGYAIVVKVRPKQTHHYLVTAAPHAESITQKNGFVTIQGGPMDFISPFEFEGLKAEPLGETGLFRLTGKATSATMK